MLSIVNEDQDLTIFKKLSNLSTTTQSLFH